ncbi:hypothetical protein [Microbacterium sp. NPDC096154]|uniref:hypothetical protein n=1 Tax=Microbacterium sp. NPDC096154 TaxID=3155549 RepID=UPI00332E2B99
MLDIRMDASRRLAASAGAAAWLVALAGCASAGPGGATTAPAQDPPSPNPPSVTSPPPAAPTPSSAPSRADDDEDASDPSTWEIEDGEVGPIEIGEDFAETLAELPAQGWTNDPACAWVAFWNAPAGAYTLSFARSPQGDTGPVEAIAIEWGPAQPPRTGPRTDDSGVGLGSTRDEVLAAFPAAQAQPSTIEGREFLRVSDDDQDDGTLFFEYVDGQDGAQSVVLTTADEPAYEACA